MNDKNHWTARKFILASQSPRRKEIFKMVGLNFKIHSSNYDESFISNVTPAKLVETHAREKALDVSTNYSKELIVGADTIVVIDDEILEKPNDYSDATKMLNKLSNRTHKVITGYSIVNSLNKKILSSVAITNVTFYPLTNEMISHYLNNYSYEDKAGSYAIQDYSSIFVKKIDGCFYNVVGFPIAEFYKFMDDNMDKII